MKEYKDLEKKIGITFKDYTFLKTSFIHRSYVNEHRDEKLEDNERMEFLGDAVLELVSTKHLYDVCPDRSEGELTSFRSALVKGKHLAEIATEIGLGEYLFLSHGEEKSGGRHKKYILANTVESLIGAIYLDQGHEIAEKFIKKFILTKLDEIIEKGLHIDAKSRFQEVCQEKEDFTPYYEVLKSEGPDHDKTFTVGVFIRDEQIAIGIGSSKQKAEDVAAKNGLTTKKWA